MSSLAVIANPAARDMLIVGFGGGVVVEGVPPSVLQSWAARGLSWKTANDLGIPGALLPADNNNFGPRLGVAYKLNSKMVLRGSYGEYFWTMPSPLPAIQTLSW